MDVWLSGWLDECSDDWMDCLLDATVEWISRGIDGLMIEWMAA